jgi:hypothetical protein
VDFVGGGGGDGALTVTVVAGADEPVKLPSPPYVAVIVCDPPLE